MNRIFFAMIAIAFATATWAQLHWTPPAPPEPVTVEEPAPLPSFDNPALSAIAGEVSTLRGQVAALTPAPPAYEPPRSPMQKMQDAILQRAALSVDLILGLIGAMAFFLGLMKIAEVGGLLTIIAKLIRPLMVRLFPEVPPDHPAMAAMILNLSANALGLGNAATPFGIKAMQELNKLNAHQGTATNSMALFLAINTSSVTLLPTGVIVWRETLGSTMAADVLPTTLFATLFSTTCAIIATKTYQRFWPSVADVTPADEIVELEETDSDLTDHGAYPGWVSALSIGLLVACIPLTVVYGRTIAPWIIPGLTVSLVGFGYFRGVPVYEAFVQGAREGWDLGVKIIPYLVAILCAVGMFQASGALDFVVAVLDPVTGPLGLPGEALPMALLRPLSGSGAMGIMISIMSDPATGPDTYTGFLVSTLNGSTETTFYVLAVYYGAVQISRIRHTMAAALTADLMGVVGAVLAVSLYFQLNM